MFSQEEEFELTDFEDYNDENGDIFVETVSSSGVYVIPAACRVLYSYQVVETETKTLKNIMNTYQYM